MFKETDLGFESKFNNYLIFFGKIKTTFDQIENHYDQFDFKTLKQTHSDIVVNVDQENINNDTSGDALVTGKANTALIIKTADCMPIMMLDQKTQTIAAVHAGWRGVENQITLKTLQKINPISNSVEIFIGPHLQQNSFEVDLDVKDQLLKSLYNSISDLSVVKETGHKYNINLIEIVKSQVAQNCVAQYHILNKDTLTDLNFHSFRREKNSSRNYSFIVRGE